MVKRSVALASLCMESGSGYFQSRFRHLKGKNSFDRWDWVDFRYTKPTHDIRHESCRVHEDSLTVNGKLPRSERAAFLKSLILPSIKVAVERGQSLALIRPKNPRFTYKLAETRRRA